MRLKAIIERGESGWLIGSVPALPGCRSQGRTRQELIENLEEAAAGWLEAEQDKIEIGAPADVELIRI
jgi:predicted RNase H-like HicB family nuclease